MQESSVYEHFLQKTEADYARGFQLGACQTVLEFLFVVLEFRFDKYAVHAIRPALENIKDLERLQKLHNEALRAENFEAFARTLGMNGNEQ